MELKGGELIAMYHYDDLGIHSMELKGTVIEVTSVDEHGVGIHSMELKDITGAHRDKPSSTRRNPFNGIERPPAPPTSALSKSRIHESIQWNWKLDPPFSYLLNFMGNPFNGIES